MKYFIVGWNNTTEKLTVLPDDDGGIMVFNSLEDAQEATDFLEKDGTLSYIDIHNVDGCHTL